MTDYSFGYLDTVLEQKYLNIRFCQSGNGEKGITLNYCILFPVGLYNDINLHKPLHNTVQSNMVLDIKCIKWFKDVSQNV